jgi:hypothetical protein
MESTGKITTLDLPAKQLRAANLFRLGAVLFKRAFANDNFDDDRPPSASAAARAFPVPKEENEYPSRTGPAVHPWACAYPA